MNMCPSCGKELPGAFVFCPFCGATLTGRPAAHVREERKVVSVLFCDLVGFTAASEHADPEDVRARIRPYHARVREEIERYGGTVEKFVGDAIMAVFGAPVAHEDDAERAVRAGLRILEAIDDLNELDPVLSLQVRIGINTGETVVALDARPEEGEGIVTGDVVNTASRLQGAAPVNGIACSEQTYRATERVFDYDRLDQVEVKGKAEPQTIWRPLKARARFGSDVTRSHATPLVGRSLERQLLIGIFERAAALLPAGDDRRGAGSGKEPSLRRALSVHRRTPRARDLAPGPLSSVRRRNRLLGVGRDRQGRVRHPRVRLAAGGRSQARARPAPR
jgi:class 3 adenylate cyclase